MFKNFKLKIKNSEKGVSLIITFFILTMVLAAVLAISVILYSEIKIIRNIGNSVTSFYAADSGVEKVFYYDRKERPPGAKSGICAMCDPDNPTCPPGYPEDQSVACVCDYPLGSDCESSSCGNCDISFNTSFEDGKNYKTSINISSEGEIAGLIIDSIGDFKNTKRAIQVKVVSDPFNWSCGIAFPYYGRNYDTVLIGSQCWFAENLNIGKMIKGKQDQRSDCSPEEKIEKYCYNDNEENCGIYGGLYQLEQAMCGAEEQGAQGLCPLGWHIPTHDEFTTLERAVCTSDTCATDFPYDTTTKERFRGTNEAFKLMIGGSSGFNLLFGGMYSSELFGGMNWLAANWSSTESVDFPSSYWFRAMVSYFGSIWRHDTAISSYAFSIRCVKD